MLFGCLGDPAKKFACEGLGGEECAEDRRDMGFLYGPGSGCWGVVAFGNGRSEPTERLYGLHMRTGLERAGEKFGRRLVRDTDDGDIWLNRGAAGIDGLAKGWLGGPGGCLEEECVRNLLLSIDQGTHRRLGKVGRGALTLGKCEGIRRTTVNLREFRVRRELSNEWIECSRRTVREGPALSRLEEACWLLLGEGGSVRADFVGKPDGDWGGGGSIFLND